MAFNDEALSRIFDRTDGRCHICGKTLCFQNYGASGRRGAWEVEHSMPRARGGTDHANNLFAACIPCNRAKGTVTTRTARRWNDRTAAPFSREEGQDQEVQCGEGWCDRRSAGGCTRWARRIRCRNAVRCSPRARQGPGAQLNGTTIRQPSYCTTREEEASEFVLEAKRSWHHTNTMTCTWSSIAMAGRLKSRMPNARAPWHRLSKKQLNVLKNSRAAARFIFKVGAASFGRLLHSKSEFVTRPSRCCEAARCG